MRIKTGDKCQPNPYEPLRFYADQDGVQNVFSDYFNCVDEVAQGNSGNPKVFTMNCISLQDLPELEEVDVKDPFFIRSLNSSHSKVSLPARHVSQLSDVQLNLMRT